MKKIISTVLLIVTLPNSYALTNKIRDDYPITVCPDVNQLQVDVQQGTAQASGGWNGQSTIPLKNKDNWQTTITVISATTVAYKADCLYMSHDGILVHVQKPVPSNYNLYCVQQGVVPVTNSCFDMGDTLNAGQLKNCYWYSNSVLEK